MMMMRRKGIISNISNTENGRLKIKKRPSVHLTVIQLDAVSKLRVTEEIVGDLLPLMAKKIENFKRILKIYWANFQ